MRAEVAANLHCGLRPDESLAPRPSQAPAIVDWARHAHLYGHTGSKRHGWGMPVLCAAIPSRRVPPSSACICARGLPYLELSRWQPGTGTWNKKREAVARRCRRIRYHIYSVPCWRRSRHCNLCCQSGRDQRKEMASLTHCTGLSRSGPSCKTKVTTNASSPYWPRSVSTWGVEWALGPGPRSPWHGNPAGMSTCTQGTRPRSAFLALEASSMYLLPAPCQLQRATLLVRRHLLPLVPGKLYVPGKVLKSTCCDGTAHARTPPFRSFTLTLSPLFLTFSPRLARSPLTLSLPP